MTLKSDVDLEENLGLWQIFTRTLEKSQSQDIDRSLLPKVENS